MTTITPVILLQRRRRRWEKMNATELDRRRYYTPPDTVPEIGNQTHVQRRGRKYMPRYDVLDKCLVISVWLKGWRGYVE